MVDKVALDVQLIFTNSNSEELLKKIESSDEERSKSRLVYIYRQNDPTAHENSYFF